MSYGLPYQGSKSRIADWVVGNLPSAPVLVDIMCGGGAVSHAALLSGKYGRVVLNDVNGMADVFVKAARGEYADYSFVPDREQFNAMKGSDPLVSLLYSFGNDRNTYLWSRTLEPVKVAASRMLCAPSLSERRRYWRVFCRVLREYVEGYDEIPERLEGLQRLERLELLQGLISLERLQRLEGLERLQGLQGLEGLEGLERLEGSCADYRDVEIPSDAIVYVDPPYANTNCRAYDGFDFDAFHAWLDSVPSLTVVSEYTCPPHCVQVAEHEHYTGFSASRNALPRVERLFVPERQLDEYQERMGVMC